MRHRERIVLEVIATIVLLLIHREVSDPGEGDLVLVHEVESISTRETHSAEDFTGLLVLPRTEKYHISYFWCELRFE